MKQVLRPTLFATALIAALGVAGAGVAQAQTKSSAKSTTNATVSKSQASEVVGYELAGQFPSWATDMIDPQAVGQAVTRALEGKKPSMNQSQLESVAKTFGAQMKARGEQMYAKVAAEQKQESDAYLAKNKAQPGVHVTSDGLQYQVVSQGNGPKPTASDTVQINYTGSLVNGKVFDSTAQHQPPGPATIDLANVIPGMREAIMLMPVGSHYKVVIPPDLAYGSQPKGPMPPNAALIFDVSLVKIGK
ncbi:MAG TPA: FKBP-type peptidyl-prolyl cis-trans isomerase [Rhodanobacteraceae bacterium]|nr:FKBP-type peptidyl-prolyl cis-trans isomerase [Rhodanobacteraceae bacterium]